MDINVKADAKTMDYLISGRIAGTEMAYHGRTVMELAIHRIAEAIAERFLAERADEILTALDPQAVANLAIAASGAAVREALEKQIPREVQHHHHHGEEPVVLQRGIFGSVKRVR